MTDEMKEAREIIELMRGACGVVFTHTWEGWPRIETFLASTEDTVGVHEKCPECGGAIRGVPGLSTSGMIELCKNSWHGIKVDDMEAAFESVYASFEYGPHDHADAFKIWQTACKWKESTK